MKKTYLMFLSVLCFILGGIAWFNYHSEIVFAILAEYNYNRNNINIAIQQYEKAFDGGYKNSKARMSYVNLIINSPLNSEAQARLIKFINLSEDDAAKYKAELFLSDLRSEIHRKYPDNYISQTTYNQKLIRWSHNPVTYNFYNAQKAPEYFKEEINNAFSVWEANSDDKIIFKQVSNNPDIVIRFNTKKTYAEDTEKYIVALTKPIIQADVLKNMVIDFFVTTPDGEYFTKNQVYNTALHEIGHALGIMGHSDSIKSIMYMSSDSVTLTNDLRKELTIKDLNTLKLLYSTKPEITDKNIEDYEYTSSLVIGKTENIANAKIREAKNYIKNAPNLPQGYIDLADVYVSQGEYSKAVDALNKALTLADSDEILSMIYYNLAVSYYFMSDFAQAKSFLGMSGGMQNSESAKQLLAEIYSKSSATTEAIAMYEDLIIKHPSNIEYVIALTNIYVRDKRYLKAREVLKEFITKNPSERNNPKLSPYGIVKAFL